MIKKNSFFKVAFFSFLVCSCLLLKIGFSNASNIKTIDGSSPYTKAELKRLTEIDPYIYVYDLYTDKEVGLYKKDFASKSMILALPEHISHMYPGRPDLQKKYIKGFDECLRKDKDAKGNRKYSDDHVSKVIKFIKVRLKL